MCLPWKRSWRCAWTIHDSESTTNPEIGLGWKPVEGVLLRTTWGTSFRPTFRELTDPLATFGDVIFEDRGDAQ